MDASAGMVPATAASDQKQTEAAAESIKHRISVGSIGGSSSSADKCLDSVSLRLTQLQTLLGSSSPVEGISSWRLGIWQQMGDGDASAGVALVAQDLSGSLSALAVMRHQLLRLQRDFAALTKGASSSQDLVCRAALAGAAGQTQASEVHCDQATVAISNHLRFSLRCVQSSETGETLSVPQPELAAKSLEEAVQAMRMLQTEVSTLRALRRTIAMRMKAGLEAKAAAEAASAHGLLAKALRPGELINFPVVTEICERVEGDVEELSAVGKLLQAALQDGKADASQKLKALTVMHEMLYDQSACSAFAGMPNLMQAVRAVHHWRASADNPSHSSGPAEDSMRLLAAEIVRRLSDEAAPLTPSSAANQLTSPLQWLSLWSPKQSDAEAEGGAGSAGKAGVLQEQASSWTAQRAVCQEVSRQLRRHLRVPSRAGAPGVLDGLYRCLEELSWSLARLQEELQCLDDGASGSEALRGFEQSLAELASTREAAVDLQDRAIEWKCKFVCRPDEDAQKCWAAPLASFLQEAVTVGDRLLAGLTLAAQRRNAVVALLQVSIESASEATHGQD